MNISSDHISVSVITGFLGAGKTTLLNHLLQEFPDKRFAIIENEFGEIGIDRELIVNVDDHNICELSNGCICCSMNDDLLDVLRALLNSGKPFDHLLVETTGIADPSTVVQTFFAHADIIAAFKVDSVICLVDAMHFIDSWKAQDELRHQLAVSDLVILNKSAEVDEDVRTGIREMIGAIHPKAEVLETNYAAVRDRNILERRAYDKSKVASYTLDIESIQPGSASPGHGIGSHTFVLDGAFDIEKFSFWIEYFLHINQSILYRVKGILRFDGNPHKMILQSVRSAYRLEDGEYWEPGEDRRNRLVFIGKDLPYEEIREALENLMV